MKEGVDYINVLCSNCFREIRFGKRNAETGLTAACKCGNKVRVEEYIDFVFVPCPTESKCKNQLMITKQNILGRKKISCLCETQVDALENAGKKIIASMASKLESESKAAWTFYVETYGVLAKRFATSLRRRKTDVGASEEDDCQNIFMELFQRTRDSNRKPLQIKDLWAYTKKAVINKFLKSNERLETFRLTEKSLDCLNAEKVPKNILEILQKLKDQEFSGKRALLNCVETQVGHELPPKLKSLVVDHAESTRLTLVGIDQCNVGVTPLDILNRKMEIENLLSSLSEPERIVVKTVCLDGETYGDASTLLEMPRNTIGTTIYRAKEKLRTLKP